MCGTALQSGQHIGVDDAARRITVHRSQPLNVVVCQFNLHLVDDPAQLFCLRNPVELLGLEDLKTETDRFLNHIGESSQIGHACVGNLCNLLLELRFIERKLLRMVGDPLQIRDNQCQHRDALDVAHGHVVGSVNDKTFGDRPVEVIHRILQLDDLLNLVVVQFEEAFHGEAQRLCGEFAHAGDFTLGIRQQYGSRNGRNADVVHVDQLAVCRRTDLLLRNRDDALCQRDDLVGKRKLNQNGDNRENRVRIRDLTADIVRGKPLNQIQHLRNQIDQNDQDNRTENIEQQVQNRGALALAVCGQGRENVRRDRTDCRTHDQVNRNMIIQNSLYGKCLENYNRGR